MTSPPVSPSERFRSASDFPANVSGMNPAELEQIYAEMRDCLIFTNRSRGQLIRHNTSYRTKVNQLQTDVGRLQSLIQQLEADKIQIETSRQQVVKALKAEVATVSKHLDDLSGAFEEVQDFEESLTTPMGFLAAPGRVIRFLRRVSAIVKFWRQKEEPEAISLPRSQQLTLLDTEDDRRDRPQMYTDPASIQRSLRDN